ncbi:hypothetical protein DTO271G3_4195 [Paecilomyces variotii]|nr:hypothetical protein DTO271G3_4195 [Paecilomyces variotii]
MATQRALNHRWFQDRINELQDQLRESLSSNSRGAILEDPSNYPPPPYSETSEHEEHENENETPGKPAPIPITVRIDVSTNIIGHGNMIVIPSLSAGAISSSNSSQWDTQVPGTSTQQKNRSKVTELTTSIISALHSSGVWDNGSNRSSVEIDIKAGVTIQGNKNVVRGSIAGRTGSGSLAQGDGSTHVIERKRRAVSEPVEMPRAKRLGSG